MWLKFRPKTQKTHSSESDLETFKKMCEHMNVDLNVIKQSVKQESRGLDSIDSNQITPN
jgi:hypothetical protein